MHKQAHLYQNSGGTQERHGSHRGSQLQSAKARLRGYDNIKCYY